MSLGREGAGVTLTYIRMTLHAQHRKNNAQKSRLLRSHDQAAASAATCSIGVDAVGSVVGAGDPAVLLRRGFVGQ